MEWYARRAQLKPQRRAWAAVKYPACSEATWKSSSWSGLAARVSCIPKTILDICMTSSRIFGFRPRRSGNGSKRWPEAEIPWYWTFYAMPGSSPASHRKRWCMVKRGRAKRVDPAQALRYRTVGESLLRSAGAMVELSDLDRYYGNDCNRVDTRRDRLQRCPHAYSGVKSTEGEHTRAADLLQSAVRPRASPEMMKLTRSLLTLKDRVSSRDSTTRERNAAQLFRRADSF